MHEIEQCKNPFKAGKALGRTAYYTKVAFGKNNASEKVTVKVDTGATATIIGMDCITNEDLRKMIEQSEIGGVAYDASDTELPLKGLKVDYFRFAGDVEIKNALLFFSADMKKRAVIGMDLLSLFNFQYLHDTGSTGGKFWINNADEVLDKINRKVLKHNLPYVDFKSILDISDEASQDADLCSISDLIVTGGKNNDI